MAISGVYWIRNKVNSHIYIGASKDLLQRKRNHRHQLKYGISHHRLLQAATDLFRLKNFTFRIIITCHTDMLLWYEQQFIDMLKPEYNMLPNAGSTRGFPRSDETRNKISISLTGRPSVNKGRKFSDESRKKMSDAHIGKKFSEETKKNMRKAHRNYKRRSIGND